MTDLPPHARPKQNTDPAHQVTIPDRIAKLREDTRMSLQATAKATSIARSKLWKLGNAPQNPRANTLIRLADFYDVSVDYLLGRSDNHQSHKE